MNNSLKFDIKNKPEYAFLTVQIPQGRTLKVEASSMATMTENLEMKTKMKGGISRLFTGESIFINEFTAQNTTGEIGIAPAVPGDLEHIFLENQTIYLQNSAFVASDININVESKWQGFKKGFFSGESLFLIKCSGYGDLWFNTYGALFEVDVKGDYVVDTGYIVGFTEGLDYQVSTVGNLKSFFLSGEGFVCRFSGEGKVWIQTRRIDSFIGWINPFRPVQRQNSD